MGSSQTRARTRVPCISRQILNHSPTREALGATLDRVVREDPSEEVTFSSIKDLSERKEGDKWIPGSKGVPVRGNSGYKGPEVETLGSREMLMTSAQRLAVKDSLR